MSKALLVIIALVVGLVVGIPLGSRVMPASSSTENAAPASSAFAAIPDEVGTQDLFGAYNIVADWPKDVSTLPCHEAWTFGAARGLVK